MTRILAGSFLLLLFLNACKKEEPLSPVPDIELLAAGPDRIEAFTDSFWFSIRYTDGNGDLGSEDPSVNNLFVRDTRLGLVYEFRVQDLVPGTAEVAIQGTLNFSLDNTILLGAGTEETVSYEIWMTDRAGNQSNILTAGPFTVFE